MFRQNVKILIISVVAFVLVALCLFNVLLIDVKGIYKKEELEKAGLVWWRL